MQSRVHSDGSWQRIYNSVRLLLWWSVRQVVFCISFDYTHPFKLLSCSFVLGTSFQFQCNFQYIFHLNRHTKNALDWFKCYSFLHISVSFFLYLCYFLYLFIYLFFLFCLETHPILFILKFLCYLFYYLFSCLVTILPFFSIALTLHNNLTSTASRGFVSHSSVII